MKQFCVAISAAVALIGLSGSGLAEPASQVSNPSLSVEAGNKAELVVTLEDRDAIQAVVKMHVVSLNQLRADLFSQTLTQMTQGAFDSPQDLLAFFAAHNIPLLNAYSFRFTGMSLDGPVPVQHGYLVDKDGVAWNVMFGMQRIGKSEWRITSTLIERVPGLST
ncbi:DUF4864 domain-containing protein [uncultured Cohaesibacter sp.]|uniref:DUF4864 domain-containing protein n=1 Tax=uncultured Cohaesibacter sp. TaxID=1002546 RepID=UPI00293198DE|nr:DUF4864 domain-containing protein [uncultured Cohaesibacter sp.]